MTEKITIQADEKVAAAIWQSFGLATAYSALVDEKRNPISSLPGFAYALALVEKELAEQRARAAASVYRCAARAGHDITKIKLINSTIVNGKPCIEAEPLDLADLSEE